MLVLEGEGDVLIHLLWCGSRGAVLLDVAQALDRVPAAREANLACLEDHALTALATLAVGPLVEVPVADADDAVALLDAAHEVDGDVAEDLDPKALGLAVTHVTDDTDRGRGDHRGRSSTLGDVAELRGVALAVERDVADEDGVTHVEIHGCLLYV